MNWLQWFEMHGYAIYIWPAYGLVFGVLTVNILATCWQLKRTCANLRLKGCR